MLDKKAKINALQQVLNFLWMNSDRIPLIHNKKIER